ncbi:ankyrin repeat domain-containing protein [Candidatus Hydrogenedentota bacterium]
MRFVSKTVVYLSVFVLVYCTLGCGTSKSMKDAIKSGDLAEVQRRILHGYDLKSDFSSPGFPGGTLLHYVAGKYSPENLEKGDGKKHPDLKKNYIAITKYILNAGADLNAKMKDGRTPLHLAINQEAPEIAKLLIAHGANVNAAEMRGWTPLMYAANECKTDLCKLLLEKRASVNQLNDKGRNAAQLISTNLDGADPTARLLLKHGADINNIDKDGKSVNKKWLAERMPKSKSL